MNHLSNAGQLAHLQTDLRHHVTLVSGTRLVSWRRDTSIVPSFDATIDMTILPTPGVAVGAGRRLRNIFLVKTNPHVSVVCFRVRARGVEHAFDRVCGAGDVGPTFDVRECWSDQHQQEANDADDDEQLDQRKTPNAFGVTLFCANRVIGDR